MIERLIERGVPGNVPQGTSAAVAAFRSEQQNRRTRGLWELRESVRAAPAEDQAEIAERYGDIEELPPDMQMHLQRVLETRATLRGEPSTVGRYATGIDNQPRREGLDQSRLPPYLRNVPFGDRGEFLRVQGASQYSYGGGAAPSVHGMDTAPRLDPEAGGIGSQNGLSYGPNLVEGIPPRVEQGAFGVPGFQQSAPHLQAGGIGSQNGLSYGPNLVEGIPPRVEQGAFGVPGFQQSAPHLQAGGIGSQNGLSYGPNLVEGIPPRVEQGAQYSRGDTSFTFNIDGAEDPEMTAAAVMRQLNRQADQDYW